MSDMKIRPVKITLDRPRTLLFDLNALEELETIYGDMTTAFKALQTDAKKIRHIKNFLCAGLMHEDESLTPAKVGRMIGFTDLEIITDLIWVAVSGALPEPKEDAEATQGEA